MKIDPYNHKDRYEKWKSKSKDGMDGLTQGNSDLLLHYLKDMEIGINV